jgi:hypothetical protein
VIAPLNTGLDSWPAIKLNRRSRASCAVARAGVKSDAKGVNRVVIAASTDAKRRAGEGIRTLDVHLGKSPGMLVPSANFVRFPMEPLATGS